MEKTISQACLMVIGLLVYTQYASTQTSSTQSSSTQTSQASTQTTAPSTVSQSTAASSQRAAAAVVCPDGQYNQLSNTVTFDMVDKNCQITVYLSKPPKAKKQKKEKKQKKAKKAKKDKKGKDKGEEPVEKQIQQQGQRFVDKEVAVGPVPGMDSDQCPEVVVTKSGKENFVIKINECIMYVQKPKKGKGRSQIPIIMTDEARP